MFRRPPDFVIGQPDRPYLLRWYVLPRNRWFNVYLHKFVRDDDDRALHDHPWQSFSITLRGTYREITAKGTRILSAGSFIFRRADYAHRVELPNGKPCWTLFFTGPRVREWGFHCPQGWVHWLKFVEPTDHGNIGKGCEQ